MTNKGTYSRAEGISQVKPVLALMLVGLTSLSGFTLLSQQPVKHPLWSIKGTALDKSEHDILSIHLKTGCERIEKFFNHPFEKPFEVEVFPNRKQFDEYFTKRWKVPKTQSWMVASGVSDKLTILARNVWKSQASEHDPLDEAHYRELIAHELVHVYHGQHNPTGDFDGMDDLGWLVEGLAVYVSGQLDKTHHKNAAKEAIQAGKAPKTLAQAWSGKYRYGVSGSMVKFIHVRQGDEVLWKLMKETKPEQVLKLLGTNEQEFLRDWMQFVLSDNSKR